MPVNDGSNRRIGAHLDSIDGDFISDGERPVQDDHWNHHVVEWGHMQCEFARPIITLKCCDRLRKCHRPAVCLPAPVE